MKLLLDTHTFIWRDSDPTQLSPIHKDPFDRLLIAQANHEGAVLITKDQTIAAYAVSVVW